MTDPYEHSAFYLSHGPTHLVAHPVSLCPGLLHLSLTIGSGPSAEDDAVLFLPASLASMKRSVKNLRQLSFVNHYDHDFAGGEYSPAPAYQLLQLFSPSITSLDLDLDGYRNETPALFTFSHLQYVRCLNLVDPLRTALRHHAPVLREILLEHYRDMEAVPDSVTCLRLARNASWIAPGTLARFACLKLLDIRDSGPNAIK